MSMNQTKQAWAEWIAGTRAALERLQDQAAALPDWGLADRWLLRALRAQVTEALVDAGKALDELAERVDA